MQTLPICFFFLNSRVVSNLSFLLFVLAHCCPLILFLLLSFFCFLSLSLSSLLLSNFCFFFLPFFFFFFLFSFCLSRLNGGRSQDVGNLVKTRDKLKAAVDERQQSVSAIIAPLQRNVSAMDEAVAGALATDAARNVRDAWQMVLNMFLPPGVPGALSSTPERKKERKEERKKERKKEKKKERKKKETGKTKKDTKMLMFLCSYFHTFFFFFFFVFLFLGLHPLELDGAIAAVTAAIKACPQRPADASRVIRDAVLQYLHS